MQCTRFELITVIVFLRAVKIYSAAVEALRKRERQDETQLTTKVKIYVPTVEALRKRETQYETQFTTKIDGFVEFQHPPPPLMLMYFCYKF